MVIPKGLYGMVNLPLRVRASTDGRRGSAGQTPTPSAASAGSGAGHGSASSTSAGGVHPAAGHPQGLPSLVLELAQALMAGGSRILQLRMKTAPGGAVLRALEELRPLVRRRPGVKLIVNDRLDVALACGARGVHLGQDDLETLTLLTRSPGSLGPTTLGLLRTSGARLTVFEINGVAPSLATLQEGRYPWRKEISVALPRQPSPLADKFAAFLQSDKAHAVLLRSAYVPAGQ